VSARTFEALRYEVADGVATVTLNRPDKLNALDTVMLELLSAIEGQTPTTIRAVATGAGRAFCARADLPPAPALTAPGGRPGGRGEQRDGGGLVRSGHDMKKPVIAAINGPAVGFGVTMTRPMDIRIASSAARMGFVFARRGVVPEACSTWFLPRLVCMQRAAEWVYTGRVFGAQEAQAGGLVSRVVPPEALLPTALALAREIADNTSAVSVALARQMMWKLLADHRRRAPPRSAARSGQGRSADAREASPPSRSARCAFSQAQPGHAAVLSRGG
jgi:enoyl-CoA hydratase/carnithine racemase